MNDQHEDIGRETSSDGEFIVTDDGKLRSIDQDEDADFEENLTFDG